MSWAGVDKNSFQYTFGISDLVDLKLTGQATARFLDDETRNARRNANRNPEWSGDFSQLQIQIKPKSRFEFVPRDTEEFKFDQNPNSNLYREIPRNSSFSILTSWLKSPHHSGFRFAFRRSFRVLSSMERAVSSRCQIHACNSESTTIFHLWACSKPSMNLSRLSRALWNKPFCMAFPRALPTGSCFKQPFQTAQATSSLNLCCAATQRSVIINASKRGARNFDCQVPTAWTIGKEKLQRGVGCFNTYRLFL